MTLYKQHVQSRKSETHQNPVSKLVEALNVKMGIQMKSFCMSWCLGSTVPNGVGNTWLCTDASVTAHENLGSDISMIGKIRNEDDTNPS